MNCPSCGAPVESGQVFCSCGYQVGNLESGAYAMDLNINRKHSKAPLIVIGVLALTAILVVSVLCYSVYNVVFRDAADLKNKDKWERITRSSYSITLPPHMEAMDSAGIDFGTGEVLDSFRSNEIVVGTAKIPIGTDLSRIPRKKLLEMVVKYAAIRNSGEDAADFQEYGNMVYAAFETPNQRMFPEGDSVHVTCGYFIGREDLYAVIVACPAQKYGEYEPYVFSIYDSFKIN